MKKIVLVILLLTFKLSFAQTGWFWQNPKPTGDWIYDITYANTNTIYAIGKYGGFQKSTDGGLNWEHKYLIQQEINSTKNTLCIDAPDTQNIYVLSAYFRLAQNPVTSVLKSSDGGNVWSSSNIDSNNFYSDIKFINANTGYCYGTNILKTTNAGISWSKFSINPNDTLYKLFFLNENTGWVTGSSKKLFKTTNSGITWSVYTISNLTYESIPSFINENTGWLINGNTIYKTTNGGINFLNQGSSTFTIYDYKFLNEYTGFAQTSTQIYITTNSGANWTANYYNAAAVNFLNGSTGILGTTSGQFLNTTNTGTNWSSLGTPALYNGDLFDVYFPNENYGWAISFNRLLKTSTGGNIWLLESNPTAIQYKTIKFLNQNTGAAGTIGGILLTTTMGNNWHKATGSEFDSCTFTDINICSQNTWFSLGYGPNSPLLVKSTNGGLNWFQIQLPQYPYFYNISFIDENTGYLNNYTKLFKTINGGLTWNEIPGFLTAEDVEFTDANSGWLIKENSLYSTTNGGLNWTLKNTGSGVSIGSMNFLNTATGWFTARANNISRIIKTTNGGATFLTTNYSSNPPILKTFFVNSSTGWAVGGNGAILKTTTGGTIGIQQISTTIPDKFYLEQNYPNPFNPNTNIEFSLPQKTFVKLKVFDLLGREIANLVNENLSEGKYKYDFNASILPSGIYFYKLETENFSETRKMVLLK